MNTRQNLVTAPTPPSTLFRRATVTQASPLRVRLDGDTTALPITPDTTVAGLAVSDRVRVMVDGTRLEVLGRFGGTSAASTTVSGIVELATSAETTTGTDTVRAVTPAGLAAKVPNSWTTYTPDWNGTTTNPTLGNGTLTGSYVQVGKMVTYQILLTAGSTTTFGAGLYSLLLPVTFAGTVNQTCLGTVVVRTDAGYISGAAMTASTTRVYLLLGTTLMTPTAPGTFSASRTISVTGTYQVA